MNENFVIFTESVALDAALWCVAGSAIYLVLFFLAFIGNILWCWMDDKPNDTYPNFIGAWWMRKLGYKERPGKVYYYQRDVITNQHGIQIDGGCRNDCAHGWFVGLCISTAFFMSVPIMYHYPWFFFTTVIVVVVAHMGRGGIRLSKKLRAHIEDKNAHK